ncbi:hypothetical protein [Vibrio parahaemolyticus]|uniref:hypothetical protein n=1 Tax=Vibrio parahaemolyticus TaxID=670 RepID=UPI000F507C3A|nr:hypothetical protein [Vibrio parahaemolyticus]EHR0555776.1 hypothetical protein [Vibrio parahaemolyticus]RPB31360.1 hypothetical protein CYQ90_24220 [Vibrio parahaemolyticus]
MSTLARNMTPERIVNAVMMDKKFEGYRLFVEGKKDLKLYGKFISNNATRIIITDGKYKMRDVWTLLEKREFTKKFAIRDADFIRVRGKFIDNFDSDIYLTDQHDSECMIINSPSFHLLFSSILTEEQVNRVYSKFPNLKSSLEDLIYKLGCLKLANKIDSLGLIFKPKKPGDKNLDFTKFIDPKTMKFKSDKDLIQSSINYSINKVDKGTIKSFDDIKSSYDKVFSLNLEKSEIIHGHDFAEIIYVLIRKHFKFNINLINDSDNVETLLTMLYDSKHFQDTNLYRDLKTFSDKNAIDIFSF